MIKVTMALATAILLAGCVYEPPPPPAYPYYAPGYYATPGYYYPGYYGGYPAYYGPPVYGGVFFRGGRWR